MRRCVIVSEEMAEKIKETPTTLPGPWVGVPLQTSTFLKGNEYIYVEDLQKATDRHVHTPVKIKECPWLNWETDICVRLINGPFKGATGMLGSIDHEMGVGHVTFDKPEQQQGRKPINWTVCLMEYLERVDTHEMARKRSTG